MTKAGRAAALSSLVLGSLAMGCSAGEVERNAPLTQGENAVAQANDSGAIHAESKDTGTPDEERSIVDRVREPDPGLTFPTVFHGTWASSLAECRSGGWVLIEPGGFRSPDHIAALVEPVRTVRAVTPGGEPASTITARVEQMSEGQIGLGRVRMSRAGEHLYMSNAEIVGEVEHWQMRNVRCPNRGYSEPD